MATMQHKIFCVREFIKTGSATAAFERSPRKSTRRASRELGIPQPTVWRVLRRRLLFESKFLNHPVYRSLNAMLAQLKNCLLELILHLSSKR